MKNSCRLLVLTCFILCSNIAATHAAISQSNQPQYLRLQLAKDSINTDDLLIRFDDNATMLYDFNEDARYLQGFGAVNIYSCSQDNVPLAINVMPLPKHGPETVKICVTGRNDGDYKLNLTAMNNIPSIYEVWLFDRYKNDSLNIGKIKTISFNILKSDSASYGSGRFALVIRQNMANAYRLESFSAKKLIDTPQVKLTWQTVNEPNNIIFTIERSVNMGKSFDAIANITASGQGAYSFIDKGPVIGENMYRLKQDDGIDSPTYSKVVTVMYSPQNANTIAKINIYPNPTNGPISFSLSLNTNNTPNFKIELMNTSGLVVKQSASSDGSWQGNVNNLPPGIYMVHISNSATNSPIGSGKFIKL